MKKRRIALAGWGSLAVGLVAISLIWGHLCLNNSLSDYYASILPNKLLALTNEVRSENNLGRLRWSEKLHEAAQMKADDMADKGYFAHTSPDGVNPWAWFKKVGYNYMYAGENLAVNFDSNEAVTEAWLNSAKHKANIQGKQFKEIGIATAKGTYKGKDSVFIVVLFGTPMPVLEAGSAS